MTDSFSRFLAILFLLFILPLAPARAEGEQSVPVVAPQEAPPPQAQSMPPEPDAEVTILRDEYAGKYNSATLQNLSKLYWRLGAFDMEDDNAVANYLRIHECKLYVDYINDDMEWKEIVRTMKAHIGKARDNFPLNFQFVLEMHLGRYDPEKGGFPIVDNTGFTNAKRIEVDSIDRSREVCFDETPVRDYPTSLVILLQKAFTLDFLKLDEHVAQAYILRKKSEFSNLSEEQRVRRFEREAYLRMRVNFTQYHGNLEGEQQKPMAILYGTLDGYEIFEDSLQKRLMLSVDYTKPQTAAAPKMSVPVGSAEDTATTATTTVVVEQPSVPIPATATGFAATP